MCACIQIKTYHRLSVAMYPMDAFIIRVVHCIRTFIHEYDAVQFVNCVQHVRVCVLIVKPGTLDFQS